MPNRLADATSPYLLQHKDNPVDWWQWGADAFAEAARRNVPVLLSVGYAACHWCHVMAHESFEDEATAAVVNELFVSIKVDREERPDVDAVHMEVTQAMTGSGGWPMTVFLTPDGRPFYAGTYFPPRPSHGRPSFTDVLHGVSEAWTERPGSVVETADQVIAALKERAVQAAPTAGIPSADDLAGALRAALAQEDLERGGFGRAPKFPPSMLLEALTRHAARTGSAEARSCALRTAHAMARGGIYDQLAGGFARYAVDAAWVVPHFEKMLYDNALLARAYLHLWRLTGDELCRRVAAETCAFMVRDLGTPEGGFASALDADTDGVEGLTYAWTPGWLVDVLGPDDGAWAATTFEVTPRGTFEHGSSTLQLLTDPDDPARWAGVRTRLLQARDARPQPARDDKVVAVWNGYAVATLAEAAHLLGEPAWLAAAVRAGSLLADVHLVDGRLRRVSRDGRVGAPAGVLEDHGGVADGFLALHQATGERVWLDRAGELLDLALEHFADDATACGFHDTADDAEQLVMRPADPTDNATPAGAAALAAALVTYSALTGSQPHRDAAERALAGASAMVRQVPRFAGWWWATAEALVAGPLEVAVVGSAELAAAARLGTSPGMVVVVDADSPLTEGRTGPAAYVCSGMVCQLPTVDPVQLTRQVSAT